MYKLLLNSMKDKKSTKKNNFEKHLFYSLGIERIVIFSLLIPYIVLIARDTILHKRAIDEIKIVLLSIAVLCLIIVIFTTIGLVK